MTDFKVPKNSSSDRQSLNNFFCALGKELNIDVPTSGMPEQDLAKIFSEQSSRVGPIHLRPDSVNKAIEAVAGLLVRELTPETLNLLAKFFGSFNKYDEASEFLLNKSKEILSKAKADTVPCTENGLFSKLHEVISDTLRSIVSPLAVGGLAIMSRSEDSKVRDLSKTLNDAKDALVSGFFLERVSGRDVVSNLGSDPVLAQPRIVLDEDHFQSEYLKLKKEEEELYLLLKKILAQDFIKSMLLLATEIDRTCKANLRKIENFEGAVKERVETSTRLLKAILHPSVDEGLKLLLSQRDFIFSFHMTPSEGELNERVRNSRRANRSKIAVNVEGSATVGGLLRQVDELQHRESGIESKVGRN